MRAWIAGLLVTAAMLSGCGGRLDPNSPEGQYVTSVRGDSYMERFSADDLVKLGWKYCEGLGRGFSAPDLVNISMNAVPALPLKDASTMVIEAAVNLCPQYLRHMAG